MANNLFPSLGDIASRTDALKEVDDDDARLAEGAPGQYEQQEGEEKEMQEIESMCMRCHDNVCHLPCTIRSRCQAAAQFCPARQWLDPSVQSEVSDKQGTTRMLLTTIPYFKEIVVSSFRCDKCGHRDTEIQSAGEIQRKSYSSD